MNVDVGDDGMEPVRRTRRHPERRARRKRWETAIGAHVCSRENRVSSEKR